MQQNIKEMVEEASRSQPTRSPDPQQGTTHHRLHYLIVKF